MQESQATEPQEINFPPIMQGGARGFALPTQDLRRPRFRLRKTGRHRRQGHLRNKAHPEPLPSSRWIAGLPDFVRHPATRQGPTGILSMMRLCAFVEQIPLPRHIRSRLACPACPELAAGGLSRGSRSHTVPPHRAYSPKRRTAVSAVAAGGSCIMRASMISPHPRVLR